MDATVVIYVVNLVLFTAIFLLDIFLLFTVLMTGEFRRQVVYQTVFLAIAMDIPSYLNTIIHDVPSYILKRDITSDVALKHISVLVLCVQWFSQLFVLLALSFLHLVAVFAPARFRGIKPRDITTINISILLIGLLLTAPMFTPYCGYTFSTINYGWYFDMSRPYTYVYWTINIALQVACVAAIALADSLIIWKLFSLRRSSEAAGACTVSGPNVGAHTDHHISREMRLAINFLYLSACFLIMTISFNLLHGTDFWYKIAMNLAANLNQMKWAIYSLGNVRIRKALYRLFCKCRRMEHVSTTSP